MKLLADLWNQAVKIGKQEVKASKLFYILPGLLLFILSFYAEFKILGLLLFLYIILMAIGLGFKAVIVACFILTISAYISISRFGIDSGLMVGLQIGFAVFIGLGLGLLRDKYLEYMVNYRLTKFGIENANLMTFLFDETSRIIDINKYALDLLKYEKDELIGEEFEHIVKEDGEELYLDCLRDMKYKSPLTFRLTLKTKQGKELPVEINCRHLSYNDKEYGFLFAKDITEILKREKDINYLLYRDSLTGLYNRRFFEEELKRLDTGRQLPIAIVMIDVNGLKVINDTYGHKAGDKHLQKVGDILKNSIRQEDILARWAGDEFVILMPDTDYEAARQLYKRIKSNCLISYQNGDPVSVAIGISVKSNSEMDINKVLEEADQDMYKDKTIETEHSGEYLIEYMMNQLEEKSFETKEHLDQVKDLALGLAERLGLGDKKKEELGFMAQFHDIGLIVLPEDLINKRDRLNKEDWRKLRKHPEYGNRIISSLRAYNEISENILSHHEWWNGQGYPEGLKGEEIPLASRIIAIADAYEVMTSGRPYKPARSPEEALTELKNYRGIQFDGRLVDEFVKMIEERSGLDYNEVNNFNNDDNFNDDNNISNINDPLNTIEKENNSGVEIDYGDDGRITKDH